MPTAAFYRLNKSACQAKVRERAALLTAAVARYKESKPCLDCGDWFPAYVMDFDHVSNNKKGDVAYLASKGSKTATWREIAKCELICSNCHRRRTHNRKV